MLVYAIEGHSVPRLGRSISAAYSYAPDRVRPGYWSGGFCMWRQLSFRRSQYRTLNYANVASLGRKRANTPQNALLSRNVYPALAGGVDRGRHRRLISFSIAGAVFMMPDGRPVRRAYEVSVYMGESLVHSNDCRSALAGNRQRSGCKTRAATRCTA